MGKNYNPPSKDNPYIVQKIPINAQKPVISKKSPIDFEKDRICPSCGKIIKIDHNFCKFCGVILSSINVLGNSDKTLVELAKTALNDSNADVRKDAVDTLGELGESEILGILTYILINDVDALVRKEAAEELGNIHNPISIDILTNALKDRSPIVRREAIEGLKKIKKLNKSSKIEKNHNSENILQTNTEEEPKPDEENLKEIEPKDEEFYKLE